MKLGYVVVETEMVARWHGFCEEMLGLRAPTTNVDGSEGYALDEAAQRLVLTPGPAEDLCAIGIELTTREALGILERRLARAGVPLLAVTPALRAARHVEELIAFRDPAGTTVEAYVGLARASRGERISEHFPAGFVTETGFGHVALVARDLEAMERFYVDLLGFGVSERHAGNIGPIPIRGVFLHCNERHHSIALFDLPIRKRIHHVMLESRDASSVGRSHARARKQGVPISLDLGQHSAPDGTFSFYGATPSGFDLEIGHGAGKINPADWKPLEPSEARALIETTAWGHAPTFRVKMKMLSAMVAHYLT